MRVPVKISLASFLALASTSSCGLGTPYGSLPLPTHTAIPNSDFATDVGASEQPLTPEEALQTRYATLPLTQAAFVDQQDRDLISKVTYPNVLIIASGDHLNNPGIFSHNIDTYIQFDLSEFRNKTIISAKLRANLYNSASFQGVSTQSSEPLNTIISLVVSPWEDDTISWNRIIQTGIGSYNGSLISNGPPNYFTFHARSPGASVEWDLFELRMTSNSQRLVDYLKEPSRNFGLVISGKNEYDSPDTPSLYKPNHGVFDLNSFKLDLEYNLYNEG